MNIAKLHVLVQAVCPITGIDSEGRISFADDATTVQQTAAQSVVDASLGLLAEDWRTPMMADLRAKRDLLLGVMSGIQGDALTDGDNALAATVKGIKEQLKELPVLPAIADAASASELKAAALAAYRAITLTAPVAVQLAIAKHAL
ncbi:MAG: hypothetical protein V4718_00545 [Pseudomonadota bacterium]